MKWESSAPPSTLSVLGKTRVSVVSCSGLNLVRAGTGRNTCPSKPKEIDGLLDEFVRAPRDETASRCSCGSGCAAHGNRAGDSWQRGISVPRDALRQIADSKRAGGVAPGHGFAVAGAA